MNIIFFGTPDFAVPSLKALLKSREDIVGIVTQPDRPKGRGHRLSAPTVKEYAIQADLRIMQPFSITSPSFIETLSLLHPDLIVVVAYGKVIPLSILQIPVRCCINVHASLLPKYRGAAPIQRALMKGETKTGVTTMAMDEGIDTGDILLQKEADITDSDNAYTLSIKLSHLGALLLLETVKALKNGSIHPRLQTGTPSYAPPLRKEDGKIEWTQSAQNIMNLIRATYPWPGAYSYLNKEKVTIIRALSVQTNAQGAPGRISGISENGIFVETGQGMVSILELKPEGKKTMPFDAFIQGRQLKEGMFFET